MKQPRHIMTEDHAESLKHEIYKKEHEIAKMENDIMRIERE